MFMLLYLVLSIYCITAKQNEVDISKFDFPLYHPNNSKSLLKGWVVTKSNVSVIHRFFDSSPFSPSGRYLALTRINREKAIFGERAEVLVLDLSNGSEMVVSITYGWGSQLGAQVQWGANDSQLFYNEVTNVGIMRSQSHAFIGSGGWYIYGVAHNIFSMKKRKLRCPIYHVSSDGNYAISSDLSKISFTQKGNLQTHA